MLGALALVAPAGLLALAHADAPLRAPPPKPSILAPAAPTSAVRLATQTPAKVPSTPTVAAAPEMLRRLVSLHAKRTPVTGSDTACLAQAVYHEAANQELRGQLAVAQVILNRTRHGPYPRSACGVVNQEGQFQGAGDYDAPGVTKDWRTAVAIATIAQENRVAQVAPGALFFHAAHVRPSWSQTHERVAQIGDQIFYR